jgi:hypothetical protein
MRRNAPPYPASAEAVFGSASRGDVDTMSDRDILIVDDDLAVLRARTRDLEADGWSVAPYTYAKLAALAGKGALFIQHLKLESTILVDQEGRLACLLAAFRPRADYSSEISENSRLAFLAETVPEGPRGILLAADILYVTVRNFGVLSLAERGVHVYGFSAVVGALEAERLILPGGTRALAALRFMKCLYRAGESQRLSSAHESVRKALAVLPRRFFPADVLIVQCQKILAAPLPIHPVSPYFVLRELERRLVALQTLGHADALDVDLARLSRWITNPRAYASLSHRLAPTMRASMLRGLRCRNLLRLAAGE